MLKNIFKQQKKDILSKSDKSSKKSWDEKITSLCKKINFRKNYFTTSSCSGRIVLMIDKEKKSTGLFIKTYHCLISFDELKKDILEISSDKKYCKELIKFKQEPCILHICCREIDDADNLLRVSKLSGWKKSGAISFSDKFVLELNSTERMEFPIIYRNNILVDDFFLKVIVKKANYNLKKSWIKIEKLKSSLTYTN